MNDTPSRPIAGLLPRAANPVDLSRLQRHNRAAENDATSTDETPRPVEPMSAVVVALPAPTQEPPPPPTGSSTTPDRVTVYLPAELRARARTAYRATAHLEGDRTWSEFVERAILAEVERREDTYNHGEPYPGHSDRLAPGRPPA